MEKISMKDFISSKERLVVSRSNFIKKSGSFIGTCLLITFSFTLMTIELENTNVVTTTTNA